MAIRITCPDCETSMRVPDDLRGKKVRCKECKAVIGVPADDEDDAEQEETPPPPRKKTQLGSSMPPPRKKTQLASSIKANAKPAGNAKANAKPGAKKGPNTKAATSSIKKEKSGFPLVPVLIGAAALVLVVLCAGGGTGAYFLFRSPKTPDQAKLDDKAKDEKPKQEEKIEPVTVKLKKRGQGETAYFAQTVTRTFKFQQTDEKGKVVLDFDSKNVDVSEFKETILKREKDKFPAKLEREYTNAQSTKDGKTTDIPVAGKTVLIEKPPAGNPSKFSFAFKGGGKLPIDFTKILAEEFADRKDGPLDDPEYLILPKSAVKPGESWKPDTEALIKEFAKDDKRKTEFGGVTADARLVKTYQKENRLYGVIEGKIEIPMKGAMKGTKDEIRYRDGSKLFFEINLDVCIDGSAELGASRIRLTFVQDGAFVKRPGATESVNLVQEVTRIASAAPAAKTPVEKTELKDGLIAMKLKRRGPGEAAFISFSEKSMFGIKTTDKSGKVIVDSNDEYLETREYMETILKRDSNGPAAKLERHYSNAHRKVKGGIKQGLDVGLAGKTIIIEKQGDKFSFAYKGGEQLPEEVVLFIMAPEFEGKILGPREPERFILPKSTVKSGDRWKPDTKEILEELTKNWQIFEFGSVTADARLVKTYQKDNRLFGVVEAKFEFPILSERAGKGKVQMRDGSKIALEINIDSCIDGSADLGTTRVRFTRVQDFELKNGRATALRDVAEITRVVGPAQ